jgi:hypothetical protein
MRREDALRSLLPTCSIVIVCNMQFDPVFSNPEFSRFSHQLLLPLSAACAAGSAPFASCLNVAPSCSHVATHTGPLWGGCNGAGAGHEVCAGEGLHEWHRHRRLDRASREYTTSFSARRRLRCMSSFLPLRMATRWPCLSPTPCSPLFHIRSRACIRAAPHVRLRSTSQRRFKNVSVAGAVVSGRGSISSTVESLSIQKVQLAHDAHANARARARWALLLRHSTTYGHAV